MCGIKSTCYRSATFNQLRALCNNSIDTQVSHKVFICGGNIMQKLWQEMKKGENLE